MGLPEVGRDKCPICEKAPHKDAKKNEAKSCLESKPKNLGCPKLSFSAVKHSDKGRCTTANHHLIPVNQCLGAFPRLKQMCRVAGYDVNNPDNGMALPTVKSGSTKSLAYAVMEKLDLQWYVGHHAWKGDDDEATDRVNHLAYDQLVKLKLRDLEAKIKKKGDDYCEPEDGQRAKQVVTDLNALSKKIKGKIEKWDKHFVSRMSYDFYRENK